MASVNSGPGVDPLVLEADDPDAAAAVFTEQLGFRIDLISAADRPERILLSRDHLVIDIRRRRDAPDTGFSPAHEQWHRGRAGMEYRDLLPGRLDGALIVSHIRIPDGGPVPDYVHHHAVDFQMIFCASGWVELVYEDQGPPFRLTAGGCVLQPPHIRHRVVHASPGLEVFELAAPAVHDTFVDHVLTLPTNAVRPERRFGGQRFLHALADRASGPWTPLGLTAQDTGMAEATAGWADVAVVHLPGGHHHLGPFGAPTVLIGWQGVSSDLPAGTCRALDATEDAEVHTDGPARLLAAVLHGLV